MPPLAAPLSYRNSRRPLRSKDALAPNFRRSGFELLEERELLAATPTGSLLAQYSAAEASSFAALVSGASSLDQEPIVELSAAFDATGSERLQSRETVDNSSATLSGAAIRFALQSASSAPGESYDAALKTRRTWLDEWSNFYVDLWANADGAPVVSVDANFTCGASCFALTDVEAAEGYSIEYSTDAGTTSVVATGVGASDSSGWTLVARMKFAPVGGQGIPTPEDGVLTPVDAGFSADLASQTVNGASVATVSAPNPTLYPFLFDVDESGGVNTNDLGYFLSYVGQNVDEIAYPKYRVLDYDHNGTINTNDLAYFLQYLGVSVADGLESGYRAEPSVGDPIVLDAPNVFSTSAGQDYITVSWDSVPNAAQYGVAYKLASESTWTICDAGPDLRCAITGLQAESEYGVRLIARGNGGLYADSAWSDPVVVKTKDASFLSSTEYEELRRRYNELLLPESLADVNIVVPTDWTAQALIDAIDVARSTSVDDVILLGPEQYSDATLDLSNVSITLDVDYQTSGAISILSRTMDRAQIKVNDSDVTFHAVDGLTQFGGFDFVDVNPDVAVYQVTVASALGSNLATVETQNVGMYTSAGISVEDAMQNFAHGMAPNVSATPSANDYALLFIGGYDARNNYKRYYDTLVDYYYELVEDFSLDPTNIYILYADGDVTGKSKNLNTGDYENYRLATSDMNFATSVGTTVRAATGANLKSTLGKIANLMTADSHLLFWTFDHGSGYENKPSDNNDWLCGWGKNEYITGATVRDALFQIKRGYATCVFTQCYSGGILDDIFDPATGRLSNKYAGSAHFAGGAAANHYEYAWSGAFSVSRSYFGYSQTFGEAMRQYSTGVDAFIYTEQNEPFSAIKKKNETYAPNKGVYYGKNTSVEHPWHAGETFSIFTSTEPSAPTITSHSETSNSISLTWSAIQGATSYTLEYAVADGSDVITVGKVSKTSYTVTGLTPATNYVLRVKANNSSFSAPLSVWTQTLNDQETPSIVVTTDLDVVNAYDGQISLREALTKYAAVGDTITFDSSLQGKTINIDSTRSQFYVNKSVTIDATNLRDAATSAPGLTISGQGATRILCLDQGANVEINGITFTNGYTIDSGGAIYNNGATLSLNNCAICDSYAYCGGGGVFSNGGQTTLVNCAVTNNTATSCADSSRFGVGGGAFYNLGGKLSLDNCVICGNEAADGGGVYSWYGETTLVNCALTNNAASMYYVTDNLVSGGKGGAVFNRSAKLSLDNCSISDNTAEDGGGIYAYVSDAGKQTLTNCVVTNNTATAGGGGIYVSSATDLTATNCLIAGNAASSGAGLKISYGNATLYSCTIVDNTARSLSGYGNGVGGGVSLVGTAVLNAYNVIIAGNSASSSGADVYSLGSTVVANARSALSSYSNWTDGENNLTYDSSKPLFTNAEAGDYTLADGSQAVNKGDNQYVTTDVDLAGNVRIVGGTVDLGAYESQMARETPSTVVTTELDVVNSYDGKISLREALGYASSDASITFADSLQGKTIALELGELTTNNAITIDASNLWNEAASAPGLTISGQETTRILTVEQGGDVEINGIAFTNGYTDRSGGDWDGCGGAIFNHGATLTLNKCAIFNNHAYAGGGVYSYEGKINLNNCAVTNNAAPNCGGGLGLFEGTVLIAYHCLVAGNSSDNGAGGGMILGGTAALFNCTVVSNRAEEGGGVYLYRYGINKYAELGAYNTIIACNNASLRDADVCSIFSGGKYAFNTLSSYSNWSGGNNNLIYDASKPLFTNAESGDYTLAKNSQAINKGNNQYVTRNVDLAGKTRIVGGTVDLGAYEYQSSSSALFDEDAKLFEEIEDSLDLIAASLLE